MSSLRGRLVARLTVALGGMNVPVLSLEDLATNKRAAARPKDLADLAWIDAQMRDESG